MIVKFLDNFEKQNQISIRGDVIFQFSHLENKQIIVMEKRSTKDDTNSSKVYHKGISKVPNKIPDNEVQPQQKWWKET